MKVVECRRNRAADEPLLALGNAHARVLREELAIEGHGRSSRLRSIRLDQGLTRALYLLTLEDVTFSVAPGFRSPAAVQATIPRWPERRRVLSVAPEGLTRSGVCVRLLGVDNRLTMT